MHANDDIRPDVDTPALSARCLEVGALLQRGELCTPAFVYDEYGLASAAERVASTAHTAGCRALYAAKACSAAAVMTSVAPWLDGLAASSLYEARLICDVLGPEVAMHLTTPGLREQELGELANLCERVSLNSLSQLERFGASLERDGQLGLRINPQLSFIDDVRHDPCRPHSKLGVPLDDFCQRMEQDTGLIHGVSGLHVHSNCDSDDLGALTTTVSRLVDRLGTWLPRLRWVNLGGGYLFEGRDDPARLTAAVAPLRERYGLEVVIEPGAAIARASGYLVASVLDLFTSDDRQLAVLDTSVNHMPEVFEYGYAPQVLDDDPDAPHEYTLAGSTCLAGDQFGVFRFASPLAPGTRVVFPCVGAYMQVKAQAFNGVALPTVYMLASDGELRGQSRFEFDDYRKLMGAIPSAVA